MKKSIAYLPALLVATLVVSGPPSGAQAAEPAPAKSYTVYGCTLPDGLPVGEVFPGRSLEWFLRGQHSGNGTTTYNDEYYIDQCADPADAKRRALVLTINGGDGFSRTQGAELWAFAPLYIERVRLHWGGDMRVNGGGGATAATAAVRLSAQDFKGKFTELMANRTLQAAGSEQRAFSWGNWDLATSAFSPAHDVSVDSFGTGPISFLNLTAECNAAAPATCSVRLFVRRLETTFVDTEAPSGTSSGLPPAGASVAGSIRTNFDVRDRGSGVREVQVRAGGTVVAREVLASPATCLGVGQKVYIKSVPCPPSATSSLTVDTTTLPEGPTTLQAVVIDAAGNETPLGDPVAVTIDNLDPYNEDLKASGDGITCGVDAAGRFFNPGYTAGGPANGEPATDAAKLSGSFPLIRYAGRRSVTKYAARRTVNFTAAPTITGRLRTASGAPIAGATVYLAERRKGGRWSLCGAPTASTSAKGGYRLKAAAKGVDRELAAVYFPRATTNTVIVGRSLQLRVRSGVRLAPPPAHVGRSRRVTFRGTVMGERVGAILVTLQVRLPRGGWRDFAVVRTRPDGVFTKRWRFRTGGLRYRIRSVVKRQAGRPYQLGYSANYPIHVR